KLTEEYLRANGREKEAAEFVWEFHLVADPEANAFEVASYYTKNIQSAVNGYLWRRVAWFISQSWGIPTFIFSIQRFPI
ncbi:hypothetical protein D0T60_18835, partial [Bacteroides sp. 224]|nr:hypothetical protein [Bacteroides sp. 224]